MRVSMVLVSGLFVGLLGCTDKGGDTGGEGDGDGTALVGDAANGATIYASTCASCHGVDGVGGASGPSLVAYVPALPTPTSPASSTTARARCRTWA